MYNKTILRAMEIESGRRLLDVHVASSDTNGGFTDDPDDPGGRTNWGWTEATLRRVSDYRDVEKLTFFQAHQLYKEHFYGPSGAAIVDRLNPPLAALLFEYGVHSGVENACELLQETLNINNNQGKLWADLKVDGLIGPLTSKALEAYYRTRQDSDVHMVSYLQVFSAVMNYYREITLSNQKREKYYYGWSVRACRDHRDVISGY